MLVVGTWRGNVKKKLLVGSMYNVYCIYIHGVLHRTSQFDLVGMGPFWEKKTLL